MSYFRSLRTRRNLIVGAVLVIAAAWLFPASPAMADYPFNARGEVARLGRQLYDFHYRNSNNNVFRRSNHNHPTKNVFRSSRYYQQRLAASYDGYPVRTIYNDGRGGRRSFVYPRRRPYGPSRDVYYNGYYAPSVVGCATPDDRPIVVVIQTAAPESERPERVTRETIEMVPIRVVKREPKEKAIIETVTLPGGAVRTVIRSVPIEESQDSTQEAPVEALAEGD